MTALQKKENKFLWMTKCEESFQNLTHILTTAPILQIVDLDGDFTVCMNEIKEEITGVLLQNYCVINYESKKLKEHE